MEQLSTETLPKKGKSYKKHMSNPKNFCKELIKLNIRYEYLIEARASINCTNLARMFIGKSSRGGVSADIIETWIRTFEYVQQHPDEEDKDQYTSRRIEPTKEYYEYIEIIKNPISEEVRESWKNLSNPKLGKEAPKYGYIIGITNSKAIKTLHDRMEEMFLRRKNNIWNKKFDDIVIKEEKDIDYRMMNVPDLRSLCKERSLPNAHIKRKDSLIKLLERNTINPVYNDVCAENINYDKMVVKELKNLAKERGIVRYNNLKKDDLIELHKEFDKEKIIDIDEKEEEICEQIIEFKQPSYEIKECKLVLKSGVDFIIPVRKDGMVNATALCKAGKKKFNDYQRLKQTQEFLKELESATKIPLDKLICIKHGGLIESGNPDLMDFKLQGTWIHRKVAYNLAQWISPYFAVQVTKILDELFITGEVKLQRPMRQLLTLSEIDIEAEELEMKFDMSLYSNKTVIYLAYIGKNLVKLGFSDKRLSNREDKHTGSESQFEQFRFIKAFEVSGQPIEKLIKDLLHIYNVKFHLQCEIYKPPSTLENFIEIVGNLLNEHDLRFQLDNLILKYKDLEIENLKLKLMLK